MTRNIADVKDEHNFESSRMSQPISILSHFHES